VPKWKAFLIIALTLVTAFATVHEVYMRMVNSYIVALYKSLSLYLSKLSIISI